MRVDGWEIKLNDLIEQALERPYVLGQHDCFSFACSVILALTGKDFWPDYHGRYSTKAEAMALIASMGRTFDEAFDATGFERIGWKMAKRGDLISFQTVDGEKHLGICVGSHFTGMVERGLVFIPMSAAKCVWAVENAD